MEAYEQTLETNKTINYKVVADKDQEERDICFVIIDDMLVNIFAIAQYRETITIPDGVRVIRSNAVMDMADGFDSQGLECGKLVIPSSVERIEGNAFKYIAVDSISLDPENSCYILKDGSLYTRDEKTLVLASFPDEEQDELHEFFYVADGTEELADGALDGIWIESLVLPDSVVRFGDLAECLCEHAGGVVYASADSPAHKYCKGNSVSFEEWDGSEDDFISDFLSEIEDDLISDLISEKEDEVENDEAIEECDIEATEEISKVVPHGEAEIGSTVLFGSYPQTAARNDKTPIEWQVLDKKGDKLLLISRKALDCLPYNKKETKITWEDCTLRKWLNSVFFNKAFTSAERAVICQTVVKAEQHPRFKTDPGADTEDRVFLLSTLEAAHLFSSDAERKCRPTKAAKNKGIITIKEACTWWLRSPGADSESAEFVFFDGTYQGEGHFGFLVDADIGVRPALWVNAPI